ncbi:hypothetical protein [Gandjariella thermophila]|uniref:Uncharacterized protein n=1 Tax=Gandjariella thermophila TaxID=1931992 RepID=A0A4D4JDC0_9PSEU|nr:hypothetical protein [Gandjariella thermophila]GDY33402.1 hypothetical protein GTS_50350 [Gandjariella thermophila]
MTASTPDLGLADPQATVDEWLASSDTAAVVTLPTPKPPHGPHPAAGINSHLRPRDRMARAARTHRRRQPGQPDAPPATPR